MAKSKSPLANLRRARTLTQAQLADLVGLSQQTIGKVEKGTHTLTVDVQERIAAILGASRHEVFPPSEANV